MIRSLLKKLFSKGSGGGIIKQGLGMVDKAFYTKEEEATDELKLAEAYGQNSPAASRARRFIMYLFCIPFVATFLAGFFMLITGKTSQINIIIQYVNAWNFPMVVMSIIAFYFGRQSFAEGQANKRIEAITGLTRQKAKEKEMSEINSKMSNLKATVQELRSEVQALQDKKEKTK